MRFTIRPANESDKEKAFSSYKQTIGPYIATAWGWDESFQQDGFHKNNPIEKLKIIEVNSVFAGALHLVEEDLFIHLKTLYIIPHFQNKGIGTTIIDNIKHLASTQRKSVRLKVIDGNPALRLYKKHGFIINSHENKLSEMVWQAKE